MTDTTIDGVAAKVFDIDDSIDVSACPHDPPAQWTYQGSGTDPVPENNTAGPSHNRLWVFDRNRTLLLINAYGASPAIAREVYLMVASIRFQ